MIPLNLLKSIISSIERRTLRHLLGKQRLRLSNDEIALYVYSLFQQQSKSIHFKVIYKRLRKRKKLTIKYGTYMHHVQQCAKLFQLIFKTMNRKLNIHKTSDFNIIDSTLLPVKYATHITQEDYINNKVTIRDKQPICGVKGLCLMNSKKQFYYASVLDINMSDANILKDSAFYAPLMSGYLLADRGFSNKTVSNRINAIPGVTLVSPYHYKSVQKNGTYINPLHEDIYKKRWWLETGFMLLKCKRGQCKLDLSGKFTKPVLTAKFLASIMIYNYSKR